MDNTRPTLEVVARRAGVSRQTVSNVLNSPHVVRAETLERVQAAIVELGYHLNGAARQLRTRRSQILGLRLQPVEDGINGAVLDRFLHALTERAQSRGYRIMLFTAADDRGEITSYRELLDSADLDAFVLTGTHHGDERTRWLTENAIPFVTFGRPWATDDEPDEHSWVDVDGAAGTRAAVEHLVAQGHSRIGFIGWEAGSDVGDDRRAGWARAMQAAGLADDAGLERLSSAVNDGVRQGAQATERLLADESPTAVVCASDSLALGAVTVGRGQQSPLAVVGFDDTPVAAAIGLTSVAQPLSEAAARAFDLVMRQIGGGDGDAADSHILLAPHLVVRQSTHRPA